MGSLKVAFTGFQTLRKRARQKRRCSDPARMRFAVIILALVLNLSLCLIGQAAERVSTSRAPGRHPKGTTKRVHVKRVHPTGWPKRAHLNTLFNGFESNETCGRRPGLPGPINQRLNDKLPSDATGRGSRRRPKRGNSTRKATSKHRPHVSGGERAQPGEFPSYAMIIIGEDSEGTEEWEERYCGGVLVGPQLIMTAAHCAERAYEERIFVTLGLNSPEQIEKQTYEAELFCFPPVDCKLRPDYVLDFVILKMKQPVKYTKFIQPACVANEPMDMSGDDYSYRLVGGGANQLGHVMRHLMKANFARGCPYTWQPRLIWVQKTVMCYTPLKGSQPCAYDSGSPIYTRIGDRQHVTAMALFSETPECELRMEKPSYFIDMVRLNMVGLGIEQLDTSTHCFEREKIPRQYHLKKCLEIRPRAPPSDIRIEIDIDLKNSSIQDWNYTSMGSPAEQLDGEILVAAGAEPLETCGQKLRTYSTSIRHEQRPVRDAEFSSFVSIGYPKDNETSVRCGGALIGPRLVVTSASCVKDAFRSDLEVYTDVGTIEGKIKAHQVSEVCLHRNWCSNLPAKRNLAFIRLKYAVVYSETLLPACFAPHLRPSAGSLQAMEEVTVNKGFPWIDSKFWNSSNLVMFGFKGEPYKEPMGQHNYEWFLSTAVGYQSKSPCKPDSGVPLYARHPALGNREAVVGISLVDNIQPANECDFWLEYEDSAYNEFKSPTWFTDIHKMRAELPSILSNCRPTKNLDPSEQVDRCNLLELIPDLKQPIYGNSRDGVRRKKAEDSAWRDPYLPYIID